MTACFLLVCNGFLNASTLDKRFTNVAWHFDSFSFVRSCKIQLIQAKYHVMICPFIIHAELSLTHGILLFILNYIECFRLLPDLFQFAIQHARCQFVFSLNLSHPLSSSIFPSLSLSLPRPWIEHFYCVKFIRRRPDRTNKLYIFGFFWMNLGRDRKCCCCCFFLCCNKTILNINQSIIQPVYVFAFLLH